MKLQPLLSKYSHYQQATRYSLTFNPEGTFHLLSSGDILTYYQQKTLIPLLIRKLYAILIYRQKDYENIIIIILYFYSKGQTIRKNGTQSSRAYSGLAGMAVSYRRKTFPFSVGLRPVLSERGFFIECIERFSRNGCLNE